MNAEMGELFDRLVQESLARCAQGPVNTPTCATTASLRLLIKPQPVLDATPREIGLIDPQLRAVLRQLIRGELPWPLFLTGAPGRGKSAAALCLADYVAGAVYFRFTRLLKAFEWARSESGVAVREWRPSSTFCEETKFIQATRNMSDFEFWQYLKAAPLVVVDDLATRGGYTEPQYDQFYDLVEERKRRPLVLVSNLSLADLGRVFDERIVSRIAAGTVFTLSGRDRRLEGGK